MASVEKRTKKDGIISYRAVVRIKDFPEQTATFSDEETARMWAKQIEDNLKMSKNFKFAAPSCFKFSEIIDKYKAEHLPELSVSEAHKRGLQLDFWKKEFGNLELSKITPQHIENVLKDLSQIITVRNKKPISSTTLQRKLAALSHVFTLCVQKWHILNRNPMQSVEKPNNKNCKISYAKGELSANDVFFWLRQNGIKEEMIETIKKNLS